MPWQCGSAAIHGIMKMLLGIHWQYRGTCWWSC